MQQESWSARQGIDGQWTVTIKDEDGNAITSYAGTEALAGVLWQGDAQATLAAPALEWLDNTAGTVTAKVSAAQSAALAAGWYQVSLKVTEGTGEVREFWRGWLEVLPAAVAATTPDQTGDTTSGQYSISNLSDTSVLGVGYGVSGDGIPSGCTIWRIASPTAIVINKALTATATGITVSFTVNPPPTYGTLADMRKYAGPWLDELMTSAGESNFLDQRARAKTWLDDLITRRFRPRWDREILAFIPDLIGPWEADDRTLQNYLANGYLVVTDHCREIVARKALALVLEQQIDGDPAKPYMGLARYQNAKVQNLLSGYRPEIDINADGYAEIAFNFGTFSMR